MSNDYTEPPVYQVNNIVDGKDHYQTVRGCNLTIQDGVLIFRYPGEINIYLAFNRDQWSEVFQDETENKVDSAPVQA